MMSLDTSCQSATYRRRSNETGDIFEDGQHILYVNSKKQGDTELGRLMHDLHCKEADKMYSNVLSARVHQLKETEEGVNQMCQELEEIYNEGEQSGFLRGEQSGRIEKSKRNYSCPSRNGNACETDCKSCKSLY